MKRNELVEKMRHHKKINLTIDTIRSEITPAEKRKGNVLLFIASGNSEPCGGD